MYMHKHSKEFNSSIKKLPTFLTVVLLLINTTENCIGQESSKTYWNKTILLHFGYPIGGNNWEYSHPSYSGTGGVQIIRETGLFNSKSIFNGEFELSKEYFGFGFNIGTFLAEIKVDKNEENYKLNCFFLAIEGVFFPLKNPKAKLTPLIKVGAGGVKSSGDLDNNAHFISFGGGLRTFFTKSFGMSFILNGRHFTFNKIPLTENLTEDVSGDIDFTNVAIQLGAMYTF